ncbi:MAG: hypothetical protein KAJ97_02925 [Acidobacteria bacterium]|nr:hypothetical protein [Acidobacteriota bacterium]
MTRPEASPDSFQRVLQEDLRHPIYLTPEEVDGGWRDLFPALATSLPAPFPIFGLDEERIVTWGYPVLLSEGALKLQHDLERLVTTEVDYRSRPRGGVEQDKRQVMAQRDRYHRSLSATLENVLMNDYHRGLVDLFLLFHSGQAIRALSKASTLSRGERKVENHGTDDIRYAIAGVLADLLQRASLTAVDRLRRLTEVRIMPGLTPLLATLCQDQLLLIETRPPRNLSQLGAYLQARFRQNAEALTNANRGVLTRLRELVARQREVGDLLRLAVGTDIDLERPESLLEPRLLGALHTTGLADSLNLSRVQMDLLRDLGLRLKSFELLAVLRRRILPMERRAGDLVLAGPSSATPIARSTRPFDFTTPGVVDSSVRRFGLVYDLSNFTAVLEEVRKAGRMAEEKALQFMYVFQSRLEAIRLRRRLTFEKFLGDGAFYTSRRALRLIAAACEIQEVYDQLRRSGFPFDKGIRIALNFGVYRLLPMLHQGPMGRRFEFFGHGIVELARLTTGKSTREVAEIAEFLVHSGYDPSDVDTFLAPLASARSGQEEISTRPYAVTLDAHGELVNEGIVVTLPFLEELQRELEITTLGVVEMDGQRWALFPLDPGLPDTLHVGLRLLGVTRLKGLPPLELAEAAVWRELPSTKEEVPLEQSVVGLLRRLSQDTETGPEAVAVAQSGIESDLVVLTYLQDDGSRKWVFGEYRDSDDVLLHAIQVPIQTPTLEPGEPMEMWLFRNRFELARVYEGLRRETSGLATPLSTLRQRPGYLACFLAAPHRAPA